MKGAKKSSRSRSLYATIPLVLYPFDIKLSFGQSDKHLKQSLKKDSIEWDDNLLCVGAGRFALLPGNIAVIRLWNYPIDNEDFGTLHHEIFHAVQFICNEMGMELTQASGEAYAYLIGYITKEVYKLLRF